MSLFKKKHTITESEIVFGILKYIEKNTNIILASKSKADETFATIKEALNPDDSAMFKTKKIKNAHVLYYCVKEGKSITGKDTSGKIIFIYIAVDSKKGFIELSPEVIYRKYVKPYEKDNKSQNECADIAVLLTEAALLLNNED
jgi:hypothetical protein